MGATPETSNSSRMKSNKVQKRKGPSLASIRRNKVLSTDGHTVKFLYLILKQLELKPVDWEKVAEKTDLPGGHAARARFSRFRRQMDKLLLSEEILEAKLENTEDESSILATMDAIEEEVKYLNPFGIKDEYSAAGAKFEQDASKQWPLMGQPSRIKAETKSYANPVNRVKLEINNDSFPSPTISRNASPAVIKVEDDDAMDTSEDRNGPKGLRRFKRNCQEVGFWAFKKDQAGAQGLSVGIHQLRPKTAQIRRQNSSTRAADPDVEVIGVNGRPPNSTLPALFAVQDPFSLPGNVGFDPDYDAMKD